MSISHTDWSRIVKGLACCLLCTVDVTAETRFYADDIKEATRRYIAGRLDEAGLFNIHDDVADAALQLRFVKIHDPVRVIDSERYFACTDFEVHGEDGKLYDLDFWLSPKDGRLEVYEERIHKEPRRSMLWGWYKHPRYTFVNDEVVPLY